MRRVVLDTNVTISAFFWSGYPRSVYDLIVNKILTALLSESMEKELIRVLGYSKFGLSPVEILPFVKHLRSNPEFIDSTTRLSVITSDPTDNIFLECAVDGNADYIVTGDRHILDLSIYQGMQIVRPKDFLIREGYAPA